MGSLLLWKEDNDDAKYKDVLEKQISEDMSSFLSMEETRVRVKKFMMTSTLGRVYNDALLIISIASSLEFIYLTYLDPIDDKSKSLMLNLNFGEKALAILFMFDWCLNFYMADHKLKFMSR